MSKAKTVSRWLVDRYKGVPKFGTISDAVLLLKRLKAERDYRISLQPRNAGDCDALMDRYSMVDGIAAAMADVKASSAGEIADKIGIALRTLREGSTCSHFEFEILESAKKDVLSLLGNLERKAP